MIDFSVGSCQAVTVTDNITMRFVLSVLLTDAYIVALLSAVVSARGRRAVCIVLYCIVCIASRRRWRKENPVPDDIYVLPCR